MTSDRVRRTHAAFLAVCALLAVLLAPTEVSAQADEPITNDRIEELRAQLSDARARLEEIRGDQSVMQVRAVSARDALAVANEAVSEAVSGEEVARAALAEAEAEAAAAAQELAAAEDDLAAAERRLAVTEAELADKHDQLRARVRTSYMRGGSGMDLVEMLLNIEDFSDVSRVQHLVGNVIANDDQLVKDFLRLQEEHQGLLVEAEERRADVAAAKQRADETVVTRGEAADAAAAASEAARDERQRRDAILAEVEGDLEHLSHELVEAEDEVEVLEASIDYEVEAEKQRREEARRKAEAERKAREEAERKAREEAERKAEEEASARAAAEAATREAEREEPKPAPRPEPTSDPDPEPDPDPPPSNGSACSSSSSWVWPTHGCVNSHYGKRFHPIDKVWRLHAGFDIAAPYGQPIRAVASGTVWRANFSSSHGYVVVIDHGGIYTLYAHQNRMPDVRVGQRVSAGQQIGVVGSTGLSTGAHLHLEVHLGCAYCNRVDPLPYFQ